MSHHSAHKGKARENTNWTEWTWHAQPGTPSGGYEERTRWRDGKKAEERRYPLPPSTPRTDPNTKWSSNDPDLVYQYDARSSYPDQSTQGPEPDISRTQSDPTGFQQQPPLNESDSTLTKYTSAPDYTQSSVPVNYVSTTSTYFPALTSCYGPVSTGQASGLAPYANYATPHASSSQGWPQTANSYNSVPAYDEYGGSYGGKPIGSRQTEYVDDIGETSQNMESLTMDNPNNQGDSDRGSRQKLRHGDLLEKEYKIHKSKEFRLYRVFKTLWTEPAGVSDRTNRPNHTQYFRVKHGEKAYCGIRRMVIVKTAHGQSTCLPILTYTRRGLLKDGIKASDHTIIYSSADPPAQTPNEPEIHERSIRVIMDKNTETLHPLSRLNYGTVNTVQHNWKVCFVGEVEKRDRATLMSTWKRVMREGGGEGEGEGEGG